MGKAARLNRERREKAMREDPDWNVIKINIYAKESAYLRVKSSFERGLFSKEEVINGINGSFIKFGMFVAHDHLGWNESVGSLKVQIFAHIYSDDNHIWTDAQCDSSLGGFVQVRLRDGKYQSSLNPKTGREPTIGDLKHAIELSTESKKLVIFYFPDDAGDRLIGSSLLKTEWTLRDFLVEGKKGYGHGILFYDEECDIPTLIYAPITKSDIIGMNPSLDNFESNYYLLSSTNFFVFEADENGLLEYHKDFLDNPIAKSPYRTMVSSTFRDTVIVAQGQKFDDCRKGILRLFRESIWHHRERL